MAQRREGHAASVLPDGRVLVVGGTESYFIGGGTDVRPLAAAELFDPTTGTWTAAMDMTVARASPTATTLADGGVLVVGGTLEPLSELFDPASGSWTTATMTQPRRNGHTETLLADGRVLVVGGYGVNRSAEIFDPSAGTWSAVPSTGDGREAHTATRLEDGRVLVAGGVVGYGRALDTSELFDPGRNAWARSGSLSDARWSQAAWLLDDGGVLVTAGYCCGDVPEVVGSVERYDPASGTWSLVARPGLGLRAIAVLLDGRVLALSPGEVGIDVYLIEAATGTLTVAPRMTERCDGTAALLPDGRVLVTGGGDLEGGSSDCAELYDPAAGP